MIANRDLAVYAAHAGFWTAFGATRMLRPPAEPTGAPAPVSGQPVTAPCSRAMLAFHMVAFGLMYFGLGYAVLGHRVVEWFRGQRITGAVIIVAGAALACSALLYFRSWRFRAQLDAGHALATKGPFALVRHPIYGGLNLLAIGTAVWIPNTLLWVAALLMVLGSNLRAAAEERILAEAFGQQYRDYMQRTRRFIPGIKGVRALLRP